MHELTIAGCTLYDDLVADASIAKCPELADRGHGRCRLRPSCRATLARRHSAASFVAYTAVKRLAAAAFLKTKAVFSALVVFPPLAGSLNVADRAWVALRSAMASAAITFLQDGNPRRVLSFFLG
jgi:hypothetical protein